MLYLLLVIVLIQKDVFMSYYRPLETRLNSIRLNKSDLSSKLGIYRIIISLTTNFLMTNGKEILV